MKASVLITDGDQRAALACTRSLGAAGFPCLVVGPRKGNLAGSSRFSRASATAPDPMADPEGFRRRVVDLLARWGCTVLLPITEKSLRALLPFRHELRDTRIPFPSAEVFARVSDKSEVLRTAGEIGIQVPRQWLVESPSVQPDDMVPGGHYPLAIKPTRSVVGPGEGGGGAPVRYASSSRELREQVARVPGSAFPVLIQERIHGTGAGVFLLIWEGELRAIVGHRRIREKPPSGGVSVVRQSTAVDPELADHSMRLLSALGWRNGVAMVEYKVQEGSGIPYLMEINGRFWGSLQLAVDAGVDFPTLLLACSGGEAPEGVVVGRPGVITRWELGDLDQLLLRLLRTRDALDLPTDASGRFRSLLDWLKDFRPGVRNEVFRLRDPGPFGVELMEWVANLTNRRRR